MLTLMLLYLSLPPDVNGEEQTTQGITVLPGEYNICFNFGYGGDDLFPKDPETFEKVLKQVKAAQFTSIMATYADWKVDLCKKHGLKFVVNLLTDDYHVYKNVEGAKKLCESLRDNEVIWGYHLFSDTNSKTASGRDRDINNANSWDPTHPTFVGFVKTSGMSRLTHPDVLAYYDFHWVRGPHLNFPHLQAYSNQARKQNAVFYRWLWVKSSFNNTGTGHQLRCLYTATTSMAHGLKGIFWFIGQDMMDQKTWEMTEMGRDIAKVNETILPLGPEMMKLGNPEAVYSTPTTRTNKNKDKGAEDPAIPSPLAGFPEDHLFKVTSGEAVVGQFKDSDGRTAWFFANHNTYAPQEMSLEFRAATKGISMFDRDGRRWVPLEVENKSVQFKLAEAGGELLRLEK